MMLRSSYSETASRLTGAQGVRKALDFPVRSSYPKRMLVQAYLRVSTKAQVNEGEGLAIQRNFITQWANLQRLQDPQFPEPSFLEDAGISGSTLDERPGLKAALRAVIAAADRKEPAVFVCAAVDRLGRSIVDVLSVVEIFAVKDIRLVTMDGIDTASAMGKPMLKLMLSFKAMIADMERDIIRERLLNGRMYAKDQLKVYTRDPAYGRINAPGKERGRSTLEAPAERAAIARMKELRADGLSYRQIADRLLAEGHRPRHAKRWSSATVYSLVNDKFYKRKLKDSQRIEDTLARINSGDLTSPPSTTTIPS
jgi:DNA invertase Pin-like site-specific DNA recombinase